MWCDLNPHAPPMDDDHRRAILQFLHNDTRQHHGRDTTNDDDDHDDDPPAAAFHISDGAKFGCDYLLYDGPRQERHAFAGLRILPPMTTGFPVNAYDLAGYVRCLNTAGKLALLATSIVVDDDDDDTTTSHHEETTTTRRRQRRKILFVDLALEKVVATTSRRPKKTMAQRLQNLSKTPKVGKK